MNKKQLENGVLDTNKIEASDIKNLFDLKNEILTYRYKLNGLESDSLGAGVTQIKSWNFLVDELSQNAFDKVFAFKTVTVKQVLNNIRNILKDFFPDEIDF